MTLDEYVQRLFRHSPDFNFTYQGGLRALFDPYCAEYAQLGWPKRVEGVKELIRIFADIRRLEPVFVHVMKKHKYAEIYARGVFHIGVCDLLTHLLIATGSPKP